MTMRFISPKTDFAFKRIFGSQESKEILMSFLNSIIYAARPVIQDLEIVNPYNSGELAGLKDSYLDVRATLDNRSQVIIEMQVINPGSFEKRVVYNLAKTYGNQLRSGEGYTKLNPVIALTITDFKVFRELEDVITFWSFREESKAIAYTSDELKMVFVELPKFAKKLEELATPTEKWIYFLKETPSLTSIPETMAEVPAIASALNIANQSNLTPEELEDLHKQEVFFEDRRGEVLYARTEGLAEGRVEGRVEGKISLIIRLLERRFLASAEGAGDLSRVQEQLQNLSQEQLEELGVALLDFTSWEEAIAFMRSEFGILGE